MLLLLTKGLLCPDELATLLAMLAAAELFSLASSPTDPDCLRINFARSLAFRCGIDTRERERREVQLCPALDTTAGGNADAAMVDF